MDIFDFKLTDNEMNRIRSLDTGKGIHDPDREGVVEDLKSLLKEMSNL